MIFSFRRALLLILCLGIFSACSIPIKNRAISFLYGYDSVLRNYQAGRIMQARNAVLHMDKSRPDYAAAKALLKKKINPARRRLLRYYTRAAKHAEKSRTWFRAKPLYEQAASLSLHKTALLKKVRILDLRIRQIRMNKLLRQRRKEDAQLFYALNHSNVPKGLSPEDEPFVRQRARLENQRMSRARSSWLAAKRELRDGYPEAAYVEIESFRRLRPDMNKGRALMSDIRKALPKGLHIPINKHTSHMLKHVNVPIKVTAEIIRKLMQKGKWMDAKRYTLAYQRQDGKHADHFLKIIKKNMYVQAAAAFKAGRMAFRKEHLDKAVQYWRQAVALRPKNAEYQHSLKRTLQLQERLRILRRETGTEKH